jgi:hypothetical protein
MIRAKLTIYASKLGLPVADLLNILKIIFKVDCAYCEIYNRILRLRQKLGDEKTVKLLSDIIQAKKDDNIELVEQLKKEFF